MSISPFVRAPPVTGWIQTTNANGTLSIGMAALVAHMRSAERQLLQSPRKCLGLWSFSRLWVDHSGAALLANTGFQLANICFAGSWTLSALLVLVVLSLIL